MMFVHNLKYSLKTLFKNKSLIFWTFTFPIILGTFFNMAFSNIEESEKLDIIDIAIVENEEFESNQIFRESFKSLSDEKSEDRLFNIKYVTLEEAEKLLNDDEISGYLVLEEVPKVVVTTSGINETVLKYVVDEISQSESIIKNTSGMKLLMAKEANIENVSNDNLSYTMIEFYTLIAMSCLYGGMLGMITVNQVLANMSNNGKRVSVSPTSKKCLVFSSMIAGYIAQIIGLVLLFVYTIFVLNVDYGSNAGLVIILALVGSFARISTWNNGSYSF